MVFKLFLGNILIHFGVTGNLSKCKWYVNYVGEVEPQMTLLKFYETFLEIENYAIMEKLVLPKKFVK